MSEKNRESFDKFMDILPKLGLGIFAVVTIFYFLNFSVLGHFSQESFAQFGDYVGGLVNPVLSFLTILLLIKSIRIQNEELRLTREEMKIANEEARKSADAMLIQSKLIERKEKVTELYLSLDEYKERLDKYKGKVWHVDGRLLKDITRPAGVSHVISYADLIKLNRVKDGTKRDYYIKYFSHLRYVACFADYIDFTEQIRGLYYKQAETIGNLIRSGVSFRQCELETQRLFDELLFAEQLQLLIGQELKKPFDIINEAVACRKEMEADFPELRREKLQIVR